MKPHTMLTMQQWFANKATGNFPVLALLTAPFRPGHTGYL
ncbi:L-amino acid N-acyltransferase YncA [Rheinheimera soli]|uniref:L-amino acid N-acyltransferase YncA n=1 Tax=Rheinheimera soli TaxID=443616 RepID=A0ABU1W2P8_9GAMM|nr:L-amino acid N-acyltransferase YncA [Rheinheimera soli]